MKKFVMMIMLFAVSLPVSSAADTLKIAYDPWPPFTDSYGTEEQGYVIDIIKIIFGHYKIEFEKLPYARGIRQTESGTTDILSTVCEFEIDKTKVVFPKEPITMIQPAFFVKHDSKWRYKGLDSLKGVRLGLMYDYDYVEFEGLADKSGFSYISGDDSVTRSLKMLLMDRISVFYEERKVVLYYASKMGLADKIIEAGVATEPLPLFIAISKKRPDAKKLAHEFDKGIRNLRSSKHLDKILQKYEMTD